MKYWIPHHNPIESELEQGAPFPSRGKSLNPVAWIVTHLVLAVPLANGFWPSTLFFLFISAPAGAQRLENESLNIPLDPDELPTLLSETGIFQDLDTLTPEQGILPYEPILSFWSDSARKTRWFYVPFESQIGFSVNRSWEFPTGSIWVKHFELEMERGDPESLRRIETRLLVKTGFGVYGVSYIWNEEGSDASLVGEDSVPLIYTIVDSGETREQQWSIPSRAECIECHTFAGGRALSFNTRQLNRDFDIEGQEVNLLKYFGEIGIIDTEIALPETLPTYSRAGDSTYSIDHQARSYLAVNCSYCHSPGGGIESDPFDVRPFRTLDRTGLIDGGLNLDYGNSLVKLVTRGSHELSALWLNMSGIGGVGRMPPLATYERDTEGEKLIERWINESLSTYLTYDEWQIQNFIDPQSIEAGKSFDADGDGESNEFEYIGRTDPNDALDRSEVKVRSTGEALVLNFAAAPFAEYQIESSSDMLDWSVQESQDNRIRTLPEGESRIEVAIPLGQDLGDAMFTRVKVSER